MARRLSGAPQLAPSLSSGLSPVPRHTQIKDYFLESALFNSRSVTALVILVALIFLIIVRLVHLQVFQHEDLVVLSNDNRINVVPLPQIGRAHV